MSLCFLFARKGGKKLLSRIAGKWRYFFLIIILTIIFKSNCIDSWNRVNSFQYDSEDLAISSLAATHYQVNKGWQGLGRLNYITPEKGWVAEKIYKENRADNKSLRFGPYGSQLGLQGKVYSLVSSVVYHPKLIGAFRCLNALLLAVVLTAIIYLLRKRYGSVLAGVWLFVFTFSPWIVNFAPNLYWVEWTWFIPMLLGLIGISDEISFQHKELVLSAMAFVAILIKSLCGYEYISTIMLGMVMFVITEFIRASFLRDAAKRKQMVKLFLWLSIGGLLGFLAAFGIHSFYRGQGNVLIGMKDIFNRDILRRTIAGTSANFSSSNASTMRSVNASVLHVLKRYFDFYANAFHSNIVLGIDGRNFKLMSVLSFVLMFLRFKVGNFKKETNVVWVSLLIMSLVASISWFVLGKSHSFVHIHMNYVLWYFGYVQMCFLIIGDTLLAWFKAYIRRSYDA